MHEQRRHGEAGKPGGESGQLVVHRLERGGVGLDREVQLGERRRRGRLGEVRRPEDRERLREIGVGAAALHRPLVELLGAGHVLGRRAARHLRVEHRLSAVADAAERVDHEGRGDPLGYLGQKRAEAGGRPRSDRPRPRAPSPGRRARRRRRRPACARRTERRRSTAAGLAAGRQPRDSDRRAPP